MTEQPGSEVLLLSETLGISESAGASQNGQAVLYGPGIARGESTPAAGDDVLMITEATAQTGPSQFLVDGQDIGFFETSETPEEFWDYGTAGGEGIQANAKGLKRFGMDDEPSIPTTYVFIFHSTATDQYGLGVWHYQEGESIEYGIKITVQGSNEHFVNPGSRLVEDDPFDEYGTGPDGDAYSDHLVNSMQNGDGAMWEMKEGTYTLTFEYGPSPRDTSPPRPDQVRFRGPEGNLEESMSGTGSFDFDITFA